MFILSLKVTLQSYSQETTNLQTGTILRETLNLGG